MTNDFKKDNALADLGNDNHFVSSDGIDWNPVSKEIKSAYDQLESVNLELFRDHAQDHGTLFTVAYIPDVVFPKAEQENGLREEISDLRESVDSMKAVVRQLVTRLFEE